MITAITAPIRTSLSTTITVSCTNNSHALIASLVFCACAYIKAQKIKGCVWEICLRTTGRHLPLRSHSDPNTGRGVYPYLPMATNAPRSIFFLGGGTIKSLILSYNIQQCEFCAEINNIFSLYSLPVSFSKIFSLAALARLRFYQRVSIASYANRWYSQRRNVRLSVRPSVRLSHSGIVSKRRKLASWFLHHPRAWTF